MELVYSRRNSCAPSLQSYLQGGGVGGKVGISTPNGITNYRKYATCLLSLVLQSAPPLHHMQALNKPRWQHTQWVSYQRPCPVPCHAEEVDITGTNTSIEAPLAELRHWRSAVLMRVESTVGCGPATNMTRQTPIQVSEEHLGGIFRNASKLESSRTIIIISKLINSYYYWIVITARHCSQELDGQSATFDKVANNCPVIHTATGSGHLDYKIPFGTWDLHQ